MAKRVSAEVLYRGLRSSIPPDAREVATSRYPSGRKIRADYYKNGRWIGWRTFHANGLPEAEVALRDGRKHGWEFRWDTPGKLMNAEPFSDGLPHGIAQQWDLWGRPAGKYTMIHGTGVDLWWQDYDSHTPFLSESVELRDGCRHGFERWYEAHDHLYAERHWWYGMLHGIEREWASDERLRRGYPRFHIAGKRVTRSIYLKSSRNDRTLPRYRPADDAVRRPGATNAALTIERKRTAAWRKLGRTRTRALAPLAGGILVGGASSRMGRPKHLLSIGGTPLVERLQRTLKPFCNEVVILGRGPLPRSMGKPMRIADTRGMRGPLAGMTAAFRLRPDCAWLIVACDMPYVDSYALDWLVSQRRPGCSAVIPRPEHGRPEPLLAIYEPSAAQYLEWLGGRNRGPAALADCASAHTPIVHGWIARAWKSVNTPDEYETASSAPGVF